MAQGRGWALAAIVACAAGGRAHAVDLPPVPELPSQSAAAGGFAGWYLRGDVGAALSLSAPNLRLAPDPIALGAATGSLPASAYGAFRNSDLSPSALVDAGVGYRFNDWVRLDGTLEYRGGARLRSAYALADANGLSSAAAMRGSLGEIVGLVNGYVDLPGLWGLTPFVGAGIGFADTMLSRFGGAGFGANGAWAPADFASASKVNFAWALMAGLDYEISPNLKFELSYRYLDSGSVATGGAICGLGAASGAFPLSCGGVPLHLASRRALASSDIRIGLIWTVGDPGAPPSGAIVARD